MQSIDKTSKTQAGRPSFVPPILAVLRTSTRASHDRIENLPALSCLLADSLTNQEYVGALRGLYRFHASLHEVLSPLLGNIVGNCLPSLDAPTALADDLAWFGEAIPAPAEVPAALLDAEGALGALYVVEGSALGGRVIGRAVGTILRVKPGSGGSFFCSHTAEAARARWASFCQLLQHEGSRLDAAGERRVIVGACASFAFLETLLPEVAKSPASRPTHAPRVEIMASCPDGAAVRTMI